MSLENRIALPTWLSSSTQRSLERMGARWTAEVDAVLRKWTFPPGWTLRESVPENYVLCDPIGHERGRLHYRCSGGERDASLELLTRFHLTWERGPRDAEGLLLDSGHAVRQYVLDRLTQRRFWIGPWETAEQHRAWYMRDQFNGPALEAERLLEEQYPDWREPSAYWEPPLPGRSILSVPMRRVLTAMLSERDVSADLRTFGALRKRGLVTWVSEGTAWGLQGLVVSGPGWALTSLGLRMAWELAQRVPREPDDRAKQLHLDEGMSDRVIDLVLAAHCEG